MDLAGVNGDPETIVAEGLLRVVQAAETIPVAVVCDLVIIPRRHDGVVLSQQLQVRIRAVLQVIW